MIKAKVIKSFYYAKDKELYLDEDRYKELKEQGFVIGIDTAKHDDIEVETTSIFADKEKINTETKVIKTRK